MNVDVRFWRAMCSSESVSMGIFEHLETCLTYWADVWRRFRQNKLQSSAWAFW